MDIATLEPIIKDVRKAGRMAYQAQKKGTLERSYKSDGSVITWIDRQIDNFLHAKISAAFPGANILTEETARVFDASRACTFVVDPIDGTDSFSLGMPGWCISVGLMVDLIPVAGIVYAPALDLFLFADVGQKPVLNGKPLAWTGLPVQISSGTNIVVSSNIHKQLDLRCYPGKIRSVGCAALNLCYPAIYPGVYAAVESRDVHIWDILAADAIGRSQGLVLERFGEGLLLYNDLIGGRPVGEPLLAGSQTNLALLRVILTPA